MHRFDPNFWTIAWRRHTAMLAVDRILISEVPKIRPPRSSGILADRRPTASMVLVTVSGIRKIAMRAVRVHTFAVALSDLIPSKMDVPVEVRLRVKRAAAIRDARPTRGRPSPCDVACGRAR